MKFLKSYKGKDADMIIDKKLASMSEAEGLIKEANNNYKVKNTVIVNSSNSVIRQTPVKRRTRVIR